MRGITVEENACGLPFGRRASSRTEQRRDPGDVLAAVRTIDGGRKISGQSETPGVEVEEPHPDVSWRFACEHFNSRLAPPQPPNAKICPNGCSFAPIGGSILKACPTWAQVSAPSEPAAERFWPCYGASDKIRSAPHAGQDRKVLFMTCGKSQNRRARTVPTPASPGASNRPSRRRVFVHLGSETKMKTASKPSEAQPAAVDDLTMLTPREAAALLRVSVPTVYGWLAAGALPANLVIESWNGVGRIAGRT